MQSSLEARELSRQFVVEAERLARERGWELHTLADFAGVSVTSLRRARRAGSALSLHTIERVATTLGRNLVVKMEG